MERTSSAPVPPTAAKPVCDHLSARAGAVYLVALFAWQAWMTLGLFGADCRLENLLDDRPVLSGRHAQHLYLGALGARALETASGGSCYDPAVQAGYPKTPIFNGSRFAEVFLWLGGGAYQPAAYKVGLASLSMLVPVLLLLAASSAGLSWSGSLLSTTAGLCAWWSTPTQQAWAAGDFDVLIAALALLAHLGLLVRFDRAPGPLSWLALVMTGALGWFAQPLVFPLLLPLFLIFYFSTGVRHGHVIWHAALWGGELAAVALNGWWLWDWVAFWWMRAPQPYPISLLAHRTIQTVWDAPLWGGPGDRLLFGTVVVSALPGLLLLHVGRQRLTGRLFGLGACGLLLLTVLGIAWEPLGEVGSEALLTPAVWFAAIPAARAWSQVCRGWQKVLGGTGRALLVSAALLVGVGIFVPEYLLPLAQQCFQPVPLEIGLEPDEEKAVETLIEQTGLEGRILWEDRPGSRTGPRWTPLLPILTGRWFIGGLDAERIIEHSSITLCDGRLADRPIATWSDEALEEYCRRYNIGWVACWSPATIARMQSWKGATWLTALQDDGEGALFSVRHGKHSYLLRGQAELVRADAQAITLTDVVPQDGVLVLSFHYVKGLRASPSRVQVEPEKHASDGLGYSVDLIRLRVAGPVARVTLTWDER